MQGNEPKAVVWEGGGGEANVKASYIKKLLNEHKWQNDEI